MPAWLWMMTVDSSLYHFGGAMTFRPTHSWMLDNIHERFARTMCGISSWILGWTGRKVKVGSNKFII